MPSAFFVGKRSLHIQPLPSHNTLLDKWFAVEKMKVLSREAWNAERVRYRTRMEPLALERTSRMAQGTKHPVRDFLFEYYSFRPAVLLRWTPGPEVLLHEARPAELEWSRHFTANDDGLLLEARSFPSNRRTFLNWALDYLERIQERPALHSCFGLHEWAMVYRATDIRHTKTPLRLHSDAIADIVETETLCCTHYDAYRFFTPDAVPRNAHSLSRESTNHYDQPGCVHVTMDLYRYAYKIAPWVASDLIADAFELAWRARELDMRASPYDLSTYHLEPIAIETREGKEEYVLAQRELVAAAFPIRQRLIETYRTLQEVIK